MGSLVDVPRAQMRRHRYGQVGDYQNPYQFSTVYRGSKHVCFNYFWQTLKGDLRNLASVAASDLSAKRNDIAKSLACSRILSLRKPDDSALVSGPWAGDSLQFQPAQYCGKHNLCTICEYSYSVKRAQARSGSIKSDRVSILGVVIAWPSEFHVSRLQEIAGDCHHIMSTVGGLASAIDMRSHLPNVHDYVASPHLCKTQSGAYLFHLHAAFITTPAMQIEQYKLFVDQYFTHLLDRTENLVKPKLTIRHYPKRKKTDVERFHAYVQRKSELPKYDHTKVHGEAAIVQEPIDQAILRDTVLDSFGKRRITQKQIGAKKVQRTNGFQSNFPYVLIKFDGTCVRVRPDKRQEAHRWLIRDAKRMIDQLVEGRYDSENYISETLPTDLEYLD